MLGIPDHNLSGADRWAERIADAVPLTLSTVFGTIVVLSALAGRLETLIPIGLWITLYATYLIGVMATTILVGWLSERVAFAAYILSAGAALAVVITAPTAGWIGTILVFTALIGAYLLSDLGAASIVAINTLAIAGSMLLQGDGSAERLLGVALYCALQMNAVIFVRIFLKERTLRDELQVANLSLQATRALLESSTRRAERVRIARDLHDVLGHQLTVLSLELEAASHTSGSAGQAHVLRARKTTRAMLTDVRATVDTLRVQEDDLVRALRDVVSGVSRPHIELDLDNLNSNPRAEVREPVIRAVQELITNTIRHAGAQRLLIRVRTEHDVLVLEAHDDGCGTPKPVPGNGLTGLAERFGALGGTIDIDSAVGFRVQIRVPL